MSNTDYIPDINDGSYCKQYDDFYDKFYVYLNSPEGDALVKVFDQKFPNAEISDVSKIEFIIWGDM